MAITGEQLKQSFKADPKKTAHAFGETLRGFGYNDLTDKYTLEVCQAIIDQKSITGYGVIGMFIDDWFKKGVD